MGLGRLEHASELAVWGERQVGRQGESYFARVQLHPNANETEANWLPALHRHGESYSEAVIRLAKEAQDWPSNPRPTACHSRSILRLENCLPVAYRWHIIGHIGLTMNNGETRDNYLI